MPFYRLASLLEHYGCGSDETGLPRPKFVGAIDASTTESIALRREQTWKSRNTLCFDLLWLFLAAVERSGRLLTAVFVCRQMLRPRRCEPFTELWKV